MSTIWITADNHFGHRRIIEYCARPFGSVDEMDAEMIGRWNDAVRPDDLVLHLGDFALTSLERIRELMVQLHGRKIIVLGNHDRSATAMRRLGFDEAYGEYLLEGIRCVHDPGGARPGELTLCGHVHDRWAELLRPDGALLINVGVDAREFRPVPLEDLTGVPIAMEQFWSLGGAPIGLRCASRHTLRPQGA